MKPYAKMGTGYMLRKARGRIDEFCLQVVYLPRIYPSDTKAVFMVMKHIEFTRSQKSLKVWE